MILLPIHIIAGLLALIAGAVAVFARKGARLHVKSGMVFVYAMSVMTVLGTVIAITRAQPFNMAAGLLTFYLVMTGLLTVRRPAVGARLIDVSAMLLALAVFIGCVYFIASETLASDPRSSEESFTIIYIIFGAGAFLGVIGDARTLLARRISERQRLARHLRRMCFALLIAVGSFFLGQSQVFPEPVRDSGILALPVLLMVGFMIFWLVRVSCTKWRPSLAR
jgi:uncharacterized membrane protein